MSLSFLPVVLSAFMSAGQAPAAPAGSDNLVSAYLLRAFDAMSTNLIAAAETMPAEDYGFKPAGVSAEVRSFAQLLGHTAASYSATCSALTGRPDPLARDNAEAIADKTRMIEVLRSAITFCRGELVKATDKTILDPRLWPPANTNDQRVALANGWIFLTAHTNEHYGNVVTYLRAKGLQPPRSPSLAFWRW
jgi:uncharacterized damage-inducible protein DinB